MSNSSFNLPDGLKVGPVTIDADTGAITTSGNIVVSGGGTFVGTNAPGGAPSPAPTITGTVALLAHFDGANGATSTTDSSLSPKTITLTGATLSTTQKKFGASSVYFNGSTNTNVYGVATGLGLVTTEPFTVEFWFYKATSDDRTLLSLRSNSDWGFGLSIGTDATGIGFGDGHSQGVSGAGSVTLNTWHHVAYVFDPAQVQKSKLYLNGTLVNSATWGPYFGQLTQVLNVAHIGRYDLSVSYSPSTFNGYIDEFRVVKGQAVYTTNFTPTTQALPNPVAPPTPAAETFTVTTGTVSLLTHFDGSNGATSATDSSLFARSSTFSGGVQLSTSEKKYGSASAYFDGTGSVVFNSSNDFNFGTGDFTIECWARFTGQNSVCLVGMGQNRIYLGRGSDGRLYVSQSYVAARLSGTAVLNNNQWYHIALTRSGTTLRAFVNGNIDATVTDSTNYSGSTTLAIGHEQNFGGTNTNSYKMVGYIDDFRIVKGQAVYTANFTPPVQALPDPSPVMLLLNMNGTNGSTTFTDSSDYTQTVTAAGNAQLSTSVKKYGTASAYFDGNGDYLSIPTSTDFAFGIGDFAVESWIYIAGNSSPNPQSNRLATIASTVANTPSTPGWTFGLLGNSTTTGTGLYFESRTSTSSTEAVWADASITQNTWHHVAAVRSGNTITFYLNGQSIGTGVLTIQGISADNPLSIGYQNVANYLNYFNGYIDDLRIIKGQALYTSNFVPPSVELTTTIGTPVAPSNVKLLLNMNGSNGSTTFTDSSDYTQTVTAAGNAQLSTSVKKYGTASAYFDGNGDYLSLPSSADFDFGTGDFTVEAWVNLSSLQSNFSIDPDFFFISSTGNNGMFFGVKYYGVGQPGTVVNSIGYGRAGVAWDYVTPHGMTTGSWNHVAITRSGTSIRLFVNGTQVGTTQTSSQSYNLGLTSTTIGSQGTNYFMNGYIDDVRIIKGQALYTTNFTPPGAELTTTI